jgi:hypothetical protein
MSRKFKEDIISEYQIKTSVCEHLVPMFKWATNSQPDQFKVQIVNFFDKCIDKKFDQKLINGVPRFKSMKNTQ